MSSFSLICAQSEFITTWKTNSSNESITITINSNIGNAQVLYDIDWGDGSMNTAVKGNISHVYLSPGAYNVILTGAFPGIEVDVPQGNGAKLRDISQWGSIQWVTMRNAFRNATELKISATDAPDLSSVTRCSRMFSNCSIFNASIGHWDMSNVENMSEMFAGCAKFNQDLSNWNVMNVTSMNEMFNGASMFDQSLGDWEILQVEEMSDMFVSSGISAANYDSTIIGWADFAAGQGSLQMGVEFGVSGLTYCNSIVQRQSIIDNYNWIFDGDIVCQSSAFITAWQIDDPAEPLTILTNSSFSYNYAIDWENDGVIDEVNITGDVSHIYAAAGTYDVAIYGNFPAPDFFSVGGMPSPENRKLMEIKQWGAIPWQSFERSFGGSQNMTYSAIDTPDLSSVTSLSFMFNRCGSFNGDIGNWNTENITDMSFMFSLASSFNQPIGNWNTQNVTNMTSMFSGARSFNQPIGTWNTAKVTEMTFMFNNASSFNQPLANWETLNVTNMRNMFGRATSFNHPIGSWNTFNVTNMAAMFSGASSFNQPLNNWNTSHVTDMSLMFESSGFNQPLDDWITSSVVDMTAMFFEQSSFNQSLGDWDITAVMWMNDIFSLTAMSRDNYDATLIAWAGQDVKDDVRLVVDVSYCAAATARQSLIDEHNWTISDGGEDCGACDTPTINNYIGPDGGDWHTAANWSSGAIPVLCDIVIIDMNKEVSLSDNAECSTLEIISGSSITVDGFELNVTATVTNGN